MSAAAALILMAEAAATCGPVAFDRLAAGAAAVPAIVAVEEQPFQAAAPTLAGVARPADEARPGAISGAARRDDRPSVNCKSKPLPIA